jgi:hypothetical protein
MKLLAVVAFVCVVGFLLAAVLINPKVNPPQAIAALDVQMDLLRKPKGYRFPAGVWLTDGENLYHSVLGILPRDSQAPDDLKVTWREVGPARDLYIECSPMRFNLKPAGTSDWVYNNLKCQISYAGSLEFPPRPRPPFTEVCFAYRKEGERLRAEIHYTTKDGWADTLTQGVFDER